MTEFNPELDRALARECRLNPLWLLAGPGRMGMRALETNPPADGRPEGGTPPWRGKALHVAVPGLEVEMALAALFEEVATVPIEALESMGPGGFWRSPQPSPLPFPDASFQLASVYGHPLSARGLREIRRILVPDGVLCMAVPNRWWYGRLRGSRHETGAGGRFGGTGLNARVRRTGFRNIRTYYLDPSLEYPRDLVPAESRAMAALPAVRPSDWGGRSFRARLLRLGLGFLGFPAFLVLAHG